MCARTRLGCLRQGEYDSTLAVATKLGTFQHSVVTSSPLGRGGLITRALSITVGWLPTLETAYVNDFFWIVKSFLGIPQRNWSAAFVRRDKPARSSGEQHTRKE